MAHCHEGIHGLARLGQGHDQGLLVDNGIAVAELMGQLHLARDAAPVLDGVARDVSGVGGGAAGDDDDLVDGLEHRFLDADLIEDQVAGLIEAAQQGIAHGRWLVVDFLLHEGVKAALFGSSGVPFDLEGLALGRVAVVVGDLDVIRGDGHDLVVVHLHG